MLSFHEHNRSLGSEIIHEGVGNLRTQLLLQLQTAGINLNRASKLREPCDTAVGDIANGSLAIKRQQMMFAQRVERDVALDNQIVRSDGKRFGQVLLGTLVHTAGDFAIHTGNARRGLQQALPSWVLAYALKQQLNGGLDFFLIDHLGLTFPILRSRYGTTPSGIGHKLHSMGRIDRIITPKLNSITKRNALALSTGARSVHVDHALIARAPKAQRDIVQILNERAVHQHVEAGQDTVRHLGMMTATRHKLLEHVTGKAPNGLARPRRIGRTHALDKVNKPRLILGLHRLATQNRQAIDKGMIETLDNLILDGAIERLASGKVPRDRVKTILAPTTAPAHKQRSTNAFSISNVEILNVRVVHR